MTDIIFKVKHNKLVRNILKPYMETRARIREIEFHKSKYPEKIRKYKNLYKGQRCFIIGNGPSLKPEDLDRIKDEYTFAANRIYNIYSKTCWRPTFYVSTDMDILKKEKENIKKWNHPIMFINYDAKEIFGIDDHNVIYIFLKGKFEKIRNRFVQNGVSNDVSAYSTKTQTVTCVSMELAMYMGFEEIYLLGVDHNFAKYVGSDGKLVVDNSINSYFSGMKGGDSQAILYVDDTTACYKVVKEYADDNNVKIYNATRGGKLEVYKRVDFDSII